MIGCSAGAALMATSRWRLMASPFMNQFVPASNHTFVLVFLRGGADGLQFLAPHSDQYYQDARPNSLKVDEGFDMGEYQGTGFRFHKDAKELYELYNAGDMAIIHACGLVNGTRSHFDAMDLIERGVSSGESVYDGWMGRYLNSVDPQSMIPGVSASDSLAHAFAGYGKASSISNLAEYDLNEGIRNYELVRAMYRNDPMMQDAAFQTLETIEYLQNNLTETQQRELEKGLEGYPMDWESEELSRSLQTVAQLIKMNAGVRMVNVDYGGWDTHERQENVFGRLVRGLSKSLSAFYHDIRDHHQHVTVLVMSEFGRRLRANRSNGTDHGHGNFMMALGGNVNGGKMYGDWPGLHPDSLDKGVDLAVTTDYRKVLSNILQKSMGYPNPETLFPGYSGYSDIGFL